MMLRVLSFFPVLLQVHAQDLFLQANVNAKPVDDAVDDESSTIGETDATLTNVTLPNVTALSLAAAGGVFRCADSVLVTGAERVKKNAMGVFSNTGITPSAQQDGMPIYRHSANGYFLFYWSAYGQWIVGPDYHENKGFIHSKSWRNSFGSHCPTNAASWQVWRKSRWDSSYRITVKQTCPPGIIVSGAEKIQRKGMGRFTLSALTPTANHAGHPIYENRKGNYMYYWAPWKEWMIGTEYSNTYRGVQSRKNYASVCPSDAKEWKAWDGKAWTSRYGIKVRPSCSDAVVVGGAESLQSKAMGTFVLTKITPGYKQDGHPIYRNRAKQYLYYLRSYEDWNIGPDYNSETIFAHSHEHTVTYCPTGSTGWTVVDGNSWSKNYIVTLKEFWCAGLKKNACWKKNRIGGAKCYWSRRANACEVKSTRR